MSYSYKRKRSVADQAEPHWLAAHREVQASDRLAPAQLLIIEAHEADLLLGKEALAFALEAPEPDLSATSSNPSTGSRGSGLIKWNGGNGEGDVWVDRFDARLLLSELPASSSTQDEAVPELGSPQSPSGWSDLPSDTEDAFFLSPSEVVDIRRTKRRRVLEDARSQRLAALRAADGDDPDAEDVDAWGGSDEEPDAAQITLMERTAAHLHASPDRARLAARILANHGADKRFAFMRGRWRRAWAGVQAKVAAAAAEEEEKRKKANGLQLMGLGGYGDSDEDESEEDKASEIPDKEKLDEAAKMEARRARAREWAAKRRAESKDAVGDPSVK